MQIHVNYVRCERSIGAKQEFSLLLPNTLKQPMKTLRIDQKIDQNMVGVSLKTKTSQVFAPVRARVGRGRPKPRLNFQKKRQNSDLHEASVQFVFSQRRLPWFPVGDGAALLILLCRLLDLNSVLKHRNSLKTASMT